MMKCLLYSRMETGLVSNKDFYDEDVNVYIAHLLNSFINPDYVERARTFLSRYDTEVFRRLGAVPRRAAEVHAVQDQRRLPPRLASGSSTIRPIASGPDELSAGALHGDVRPAEEADVGRGRTYYRFAYSYSQQIHGRNTAITEVLEKLSVGFDKYLRILAHMRGEYLNLRPLAQPGRDLPSRTRRQRVGPRSRLSRASMTSSSTSTSSGSGLTKEACATR